MTEACRSESKKKIMVVDDDEMHLEIARELLQDEHCEVITHKSDYGIDVTILVKDIRPDLILLDINMPGLSGDKLATILRSGNDTNHIPIVFYSSNDENSLREIVSTCEVQGYICKGNFGNLRKKVTEFLGMAPSNNVHSGL